MKIVVTSKKPIMAVGHGRLPIGVPVDVPASLAQFFIERGEAVLLETKEAMDSPLAEDGEEAQSSSLPVGQASQEMTSSESESGEVEQSDSEKVEESAETLETSETAETAETETAQLKEESKAARKKKGQ